MFDGGVLAGEGSAPPGHLLAEAGCCDGGLTHQGQDLDISAHMFFAELSYDVDWWRPRFSFLWASGDDDPFDSNGKGFDTILDNPNISGGANSYWIRQSLRLAGTGLNSRLSTFPNLRPNKFQGQANFVNPGLFFLTAGADLDLAVEWRATLDLSYLMFAKTGALEPLLNQNDIDRALGWEATLGLQYRPNAVNNIQLFSGASAFFPGAGYRDRSGVCRARRLSQKGQACLRHGSTSVHPALPYSLWRTHTRHRHWD